MALPLSCDAWPWQHIDHSVVQSPQHAYYSMGLGAWDSSLALDNPATHVSQPYVLLGTPSSTPSRIGQRLDKTRYPRAESSAYNAEMCRISLRLCFLLMLRYSILAFEALCDRSEMTQTNRSWGPEDKNRCRAWQHRTRMTVAQH
jgi:hypothetical protein